MRSVKLGLIIAVIVVAVGVLGVTYIHSVRNGAYRLEEQIATAKSDIDIQQKRRADLLPNLVDCIKAYDRHEYETLMDVVAARNISDGVAGDTRLAVSAVAEAYPELQSSAQYRDLMNELATTENLIANYRGNYNKQVRAYRQYVRRFPNSVVLSLMGYETIADEYLDYNAPVDAPTGLFG